MTKVLNFRHNSTTEDGEPKWSTVDKTALPRVAHADHGDEDNKSTWKYPHHWIKNGGDKDEDNVYTSGTMYLHKGGLNAAWSAANGGRSGEEAPQAVKDHLQEHRRALGLDNDSNDWTGYTIKAKTKEKEAEIWIYEDIGSGWFGGLSAKQFAKDIKEAGDLDSIILRINSPGGEVFDGIAIYNILRTHKASVTTYIDGLAASIASVIAMAADAGKLFMADNAIMMIHNAWTFAAGDANGFRKMAEDLDKINTSIIKSYVNRASISEEEIRVMMDAETWMNADEALSNGFIDDIIDALPMAAHFDLEKYKFKNAPFGSPKKPAAPSNRQVENPTIKPPTLEEIEARWREQQLKLETRGF